MFIILYFSTTKLWKSYRLQRKWKLTLFSMKLCWYNVEVRMGHHQKSRCQFPFDFLVLRLLKIGLFYFWDCSFYFWVEQFCFRMIFGDLEFLFKQLTEWPEGLKPAQSAQPLHNLDVNVLEIKISIRIHVRLWLQ